MTINKTKLIAAIFIIAASILYMYNDVKFNPLVLILKVIGIGVFYTQWLKIKNNITFFKVFSKLS